MCRSAGVGGQEIESGFAVCPSESFGGNAELQRSVDQKNMSCQLF